MADHEPAASSKVSISKDVVDSQASTSPDHLHFPSTSFLLPYLPPQASSTPFSTSNPPLPLSKPHVTLTYAVSLDSALSIAPGRPTALSGPESKAMTHFLRSQHDAILIGVGTALADDPSLNCRLDPGAGKEVPQPRPVVLDPRGRWDFAGSRVLRLAREGRGKPPWIFLRAEGPVERERKVMLEDVGGGYLVCGMAAEGMMPWEEVFEVLGRKGIRSVMVEGGGRVINDVLRKENRELVDSVIVTIAPMYLGSGGVVVSPENTQEGAESVHSVRFTDVRWQPLGQDVVMCGRISKEELSYQ